MRRSLPLVLLLLVLVPAAMLGPAAAQDCSPLSDQATEPCQHGGQCQNGTCVCTNGYDSTTCGWVTAETCDCLACLNGGYMMNANETDRSGLIHACWCPPQWAGRNCDLCRSVDSCRPLYPPETEDPLCDITPVVVNYKVFDCYMHELSDELAYLNTSIRAEIYRKDLNISQAVGHFQLWNNVELANTNPVRYELREIFYCDVSNCSAIGDEAYYMYSCADTKCYFTGHLYWDQRWIKFVEEGLVGLTEFGCSSVRSDGEMECELYSVGFESITDTLRMKCISGECLSEPRPIVEQVVNYRGIIFAALASVVLIGTLLLSMYIYRRHQQKYFSFKGLDGKDIQFLELADNGLQFSNDTLLFENISYTLDGKILVNSVDGLAMPGQVLAIIGASGAGKTTLLDILAQRVKRGTVTGTVTINSSPIDSSFIRITSYVDQEPAALGTLSVREMLMAAAQLRLPEIVKTDEKKKRIQSLAFELGIEHILDRRYGETGNRGISGGEKRRVQIACQLVTGPSIVFLDEPTSGLDAFNALTVCRFLKSYAAKKQRTIIMSIHQPRSDIFFSFDRLLVLGNGYTIYHGETSSAKEYFEQLGYRCPDDFNPADFILDVTVSEQDKLLMLHQRFVESPAYQKYLRESKLYSSGVRSVHSNTFSVVASTKYGSVNRSTVPPAYGSLSAPEHESVAQHEQAPETSTTDSEPLLGNRPVLADGYKDTYATSWFTQVVVLSGRSFADMYRYPLLLQMHLLFAVISGVLIGLIFFNLTLDFAGTQNRIGMLLFILIVLAFGSMSSIGFMNRERDQFTQERASGYYRPSAYYAVKVLFDLVPLRIIPACVLGLIVYFMTGLQSDVALMGHFLLVLILFNSVTALICLCISTVIRNVSLANLVAIITLLFFMLFQNALVNIDAMSPYVSWITYLSPFRFALNSIMVNEFDNLWIYFDPYGLEDPEYVPGRSVLTLFAFKPNWAYTIDLYALSAMLGGWLLIGLVSLVLFVRDVR